VEQRSAGVAVRAIVGGAAAAWLAAELILLLLVARPGAGPGTLRDVASTVAAFGWLAGLACAALAPLAALLAWAVHRVRGGGALACGLVGAAGGLAVVQLLGGNGALLSVIGAVVGAVCGLAGWAASSSAGRSNARVIVLLVVAAGVWGGALLTV
jgi:hypothetical protein